MQVLVDRWGQSRVIAEVLAISLDSPSLVFFRVKGELVLMWTEGHSQWSSRSGLPSRYQLALAQQMRQLVEPMFSSLKEALSMKQVINYVDMLLTGVYRPNFLRNNLSVLQRCIGLSHWTEVESIPHKCFTTGTHLLEDSSGFMEQTGDGI